MKTNIIKEGRAWRWEVKQGRKIIAGGYCRTKKDAENDAGIATRPNEKLCHRAGEAGGS